VWDFLAVFPWFVAGSWDVEYLIRLVRILKLPNALNMLDGRGVSFLISSCRSAKDREQEATVNYAVRFWTSLI
jgi:hypothetical protein